MSTDSSTTKTTADVSTTRSRGQGTTKTTTAPTSSSSSSSSSTRTSRPTSAAAPATSRLTQKPQAGKEARKPENQLQQTPRQQPLHRQQYPPAVPPPGAITRCSRDVLSLILAQLNWTDFLSAIKINRQWNSLATLSTSWPQNSDTELGAMIARDCHFTLSRDRYGGQMDPDALTAAQNMRCITIRFHEKKKKLIEKGKLPVKPNILIASPPVYYLSVPAPSSSSQRMLQHASSVYLNLWSLSKLQSELAVIQLAEVFATIRRIMPNLKRIRLSLCIGLIGAPGNYSNLVGTETKRHTSEQLCQFFFQQPHLQWIELDDGGSVFRNAWIVEHLVSELSVHSTQLRVLHMHSANSSLIQPQILAHFHALEYLRIDMTMLQSGVFDVIRRLSIDHNLNSLSLISTPMMEIDEVRMLDFRALFEDPIITNRLKNTDSYGRMIRSENGELIPDLAAADASSLPYQPSALTRLHLNPAVHLPLRDILIILSSLTDVHLESSEGMLPTDILIPPWIKEFRVSGGAIEGKSSSEDARSPVLSEYFTIGQYNRTWSENLTPSCIDVHAIIALSTFSVATSSPSASSSQLEVFHISLRNNGLECPSFRFSNSILNKFINENLASSLHSLTDLKLHEITIRDPLDCLDRFVSLRKLSLLIRPQAEMKYLLHPLSRLPAFHTLALVLPNSDPVSFRDDNDNLVVEKVDSFQLDTKELILSLLASAASSSSKSWSTLRLHSLSSILTSKQLMEVSNTRHGMAKSFIAMTPAMMARTSMKNLNLRSEATLSDFSFSSSFSSPPLDRLSSFRVNLTTENPVHGEQVVYGLRVKLSGSGRGKSSKSRSSANSASSSSTSTSSQLNYEWRRVF